MRLPSIYASTKNSPAPWDVFIRWRVAIPGDSEDRIFADPALWEKWISFYLETPAELGFCFFSGENTRLALQHPKRIRSSADGAKIISSNDKDGFTFRGRFTDKNGDQAFSLGFQATQKIHNTLRWLIARQGRRDGDQAIVAWSHGGQNLPEWLESSDNLFGSNNSSEESSPLEHVETGQGFSRNLSSKIGGYRTSLKDEEISIIALDSSTPGRISLTYFRDLSNKEFLDRIEKWHLDAAWLQNFGKDRQFIGAPSPKEIAQAAYGRRLDPQLLSGTYRRILPCILDQVPVPPDLVSLSCNRAVARQSMESWEWERVLGVACSLYRKQQIQNKGHQFTMSLERDRKSRDYLYGRLLAYADVLEKSAHAKDENRPSNAARLMQRFADFPYSTWRTIELQLVPYEQRLGADKPGLLRFFQNERDEVMELFSADEFEVDKRLAGEFLLGFHTQRTALHTKRSDKNDDESQNETN